MRRSIARGRVFPQSFSTDRRYGRLSLKAIAIFPLMWVNGDDQGRLSGDPEEIKYAVCPNVDHITKKDIPELLKELEDNKLILCYDTPKTAAIQILDWWDTHQKLQWAWPSEYQPPEGWRDHLRYKRDAHTVETLHWPVSGESEPGASKSIYFILDTAANAIKIGISDSPEKRLKDLQASNPHPLKLLKVLENRNLSEEQELHQRFASSGINAEWFNYSEEIKTFLSLSPENSPESSPENTPENTPENSPEEEAKQREGTEEKKVENVTVTEKENETVRGRGNSPDYSGEQPSPTISPVKLLNKLTECYRIGWGTIRAKEPNKVIPRRPDARIDAQLRDLANELSSGGGCPLEYIDQAFREAAGHQKMHLSYVRAVLLDWLGLARSPP